MGILFFNHPGLVAFIKALCWTLVHSLWQGLAVAVVGGIVVALTKKKKARFRYNLFIALFALLLVIIGITFFKELQNGMGSQQTSLESATISTENSSYAEAAATRGERAQSISGLVTSFMDKYASVIVLFWAILFGVKLFQFSYGFNYMRRLKISAVSPAAEWTLKINALSKQLGLKHIPQLMESSLVNVPLTFGFFKATILVPLSLLSNLPPGQVEAVLLHELAHIKRNDYLVNLIQNSAELFFFFNPALLWLSSLIRQERESCCDEMVLRHTEQTETYLEALLSFQEYSLAHAYPAMAIATNRNYLLRRVQRMLTNENQNLNNMEKTFLVLGIMTMSAFGFIAVPDKQDPVIQQTGNSIIAVPQLRKTTASVDVAASSTLPVDLSKKQLAIAAIISDRDTVPKQKIKTNRYSNVTTKSSDDGQNKVYEVEATDSEGKNIRLKKLNDELTELEVDGKKLEATNNEFKDHLVEIEELERNMGKELIEVQKIQHGKLKEHMELQKKEHEVLKQKMNLQKKDFEKHREELQKHQEEFQKHRKELEKVKVENVPKIKKMQLEQNEAKKVMAIQKKNAIQDRDMIKKRAELVEREKPYRETNDEVSSIINELSKRGLVTNPDVLTFTLSKKEFKVNGKNGPEDLHQLLVDKYIKKNGDLFSYSKSGGSVSTTINKE
ncbi:MAG TPA: M56 family metallopeptidase [Chitinophagaceae bacterium]|nr:M56 family metallopeptidase [Chitinophagaceae bacterium]